MFFLIYILIKQDRLVFHNTVPYSSKDLTGEQYIKLSYMKSRASMKLLEQARSMNPKTQRLFPSYTELLWTIKDKSADRIIPIDPEIDRQS